MSVGVVDNTHGCCHGLQHESGLLIDRREPISESAFVELVLWRVPQPVRGSTHVYKYRLAHVVGGVDELLATFNAEIARWNDENRDS